MVEQESSYRAVWTGRLVSRGRLHEMGAGESHLASHFHVTTNMSLKEGGEGLRLEVGRGTREGEDKRLGHRRRIRRITMLTFSELKDRLRIAMCS